jgi:hypothetical protein
MITRILKLEGLAIAAVAIAAYTQTGQGLWFFLIFILAPDLAMVGYMKSVRIGAICYNAAHNYILPTILLGIGWRLQADVAVSLALIWIAHIGLDRLIGYGLKYPTHFKDTHLNRLDANQD